MSEIRIPFVDAVELAELLTFLADWLSGSQRPTLAGSLTALVGHDANGLDELHHDLHGWCSCSASATANTSSENPHHDRQKQW